MAVRAIGAALAILASDAAWAQNPQPNTLTPAEKAAGWILLFDGTDKNAHWRVGLSGTTNSWMVEDGALASAPNSTGNEIFTKEQFSDFELSMEWKLNLKGNSGIFYRVSGPSRSCSGSEYGILDDVNGDDRTSMGHMPGETSMPIKRTGAVYDLYPTVQNGVTGAPYVALAKPFDQWNQGTVWANGKSIEHWLNGRKVTDFQLGTPDWLQRFQFSKYYGMCPDSRDTWARHSAGFIGMQDHGGGLRVWFRNIKIRPFISGGKLTPPLVSPAGGKFVAPVRVGLDAAIIGSIVVYTLDGTDPTPDSPVYRDSLTIGSSGVVKARTYRQGFPMSDIRSATFTFDGTGAGRRRQGPGMVPDCRLVGNGLRIRNPARELLFLDVLGTDGKKMMTFEVPSGERQIDMTGWRGLHVLELRQGKWNRSLKFLMP